MKVMTRRETHICNLSDSGAAPHRDQRSKDVRLNRALEELERTKAQLRQLRDDKEGSGQGARGEDEPRERRSGARPGAACGAHLGLCGTA